MSTIRGILSLVMMSLIVSMTPSRLVASATAAPRPNVPWEALRDPSAPDEERDPERALVILRVWALVPEKVQLSDPSARTVRATVLGIDTELHQLKVQTDQGQRLTLFLAPAFLARLQVGATCLLQVAQQSLQESVRPPAHEAPVW